MSDVHRELQTELALESPAAIAALSADDATRFLAAVRAARSAQHATIAKAIDDAMSHVPWVLRGALKAILF